MVWWYLEAEGSSNEESKYDAVGIAKKTDETPSAQQTAITFTGPSMQTSTLDPTQESAYCPDCQVALPEALSVLLQ